jgi:hypothetical protein
MEIKACKIPTTYVSSIGAELELPTALAVDLTLNEWPVSSGFHTVLNQRWTIVYRGGVSDKLKRAAIKAGLEIKSRKTRAGWGLVDISLPGATQCDCQKATDVFDKFAEIYSQEKSPPRKVECLPVKVK